MMMSSRPLETRIDGVLPVNCSLSVGISVSSTDPGEDHGTISTRSVGSFRRSI